MGIAAAGTEPDVRSHLSFNQPLSRGIVPGHLVMAQGRVVTGPFPHRAESALPGSKEAATATTRQEQWHRYLEGRVVQLRVVGASQQAFLRELRRRGQPQEAKHNSSCATGELPLLCQFFVGPEHKSVTDLITMMIIPFLY